MSFHGISYLNDKLIKQHFIYIILELVIINSIYPANSIRTFTVNPYFPINSSSTFYAYCYPKNYFRKKTIKLVINLLNYTDILSGVTVETIYLEIV